MRFDRYGWRFGRWALFASVCSLLPVSGCAVATDLINPAVFNQFGIDPAAVSGVTGRVVVNFENRTNSSVAFFAYEASSSSDVTRDSRNFSVVVEANQIRNEVLDCPLGQFAPGLLTDTFEYENLAARLSGTGGEEGDVEYTGAILISPGDFACGDVLNVRIDPTAGGGYVITVQVFPS